MPESDCLDDINIRRIKFRFSSRYPVNFQIIKHIGADYEVIHIHGIDFFSDFLLLMKDKIRQPIVISTHGGFFHTKAMCPFKLLWFRTVTKLTLNKADIVIAEGPNDYNIFRKIISKNLAVLEPGINLRFCKVEKKIQKNCLVYWGRICENKKIEDLINTIYVAKKRRNNIKLILIGEDWHDYTKKLGKLVDGLGLNDSVYFLGYLTYQEIVEYIEKAHLFVSASEYEGFGITVIEAMGSSTVPFVNNIESFRNIVRNGHNGFLVDFKNYEETSERLISILDEDLDYLRKIGERSRETAQGYSWQSVGEKYITLYNKLILSHRSLC